MFRVVLFIIVHIFNTFDIIDICVAYCAFDIIQLKRYISPPRMLAAERWWSIWKNIKTFVQQSRAVLMVK